MASLLEQLRGMTTVVSDTGDFNQIQQFHPQDATTNPSLLQSAAEMPGYQSVVDDVLKTARADAGEAASRRSASTGRNHGLRPESPDPTRHHCRTTGTGTTAINPSHRNGPWTPLALPPAHPGSRR